MRAVRILIGSDKFRRNIRPELEVLRTLGVFSDPELLQMDVETTQTFPNRKIGSLRDGFEASFLVLERDPRANLDNLRSIFLRIKQGQVVTVPGSAISRAGPDCVAGSP